MVILRFGLLWERNLAAERPVKPPPMIKKSVSWSADSGVMAGDSRDLCQKDGVALRVHEKSMLKEKAKKQQDHDFTLTFLFFLLSFILCTITKPAWVMCWNTEVGGAI